MWIRISRRFLSSSLVPFLLIGLNAWIIGCSKSRVQTRTYRKGESVPVGPLMYTALDTEWKEQLDDAGKPRLPGKQFFLVRLSVTHNGGNETVIPALSLQDTSGQVYEEVFDGSGVPNWIGRLRRLRGGQTEKGVIVFDVPYNSYKLRLPVETEDPEDEQFILIDLPFDLSTDAAPIPSPGKQ